MNKLAILFLAALVFLTACNKDFKVGADYKDITVVYALLSMNDSINYVKITKGYYDETQDNLLLGQNSDSIYYNNLEVKIEELSNGAVAKTTILPRVDLNLEGFDKDSGIFAKAPNYAYKFYESGGLKADRTYRLKIKNIASGKELQGETDLINSNQIKFQKPYINTQQLNFSVPFENYTFAWSALPNAVFFDVVLRFWYQEINNNTLQTVIKFKDLPLMTNVISNGAGGSTIMANSDFFRILNSELGAPLSYITRRVDTPDLIVLAGGQVLKTYIDATTAQGGITYDQIKPNYTNLKGEDVLGIVSTRGIRIMEQIAFSKATTDSIISGSLTKNLNFVGISTE